MIFWIFIYSFQPHSIVMIVWWVWPLFYLYFVVVEFETKNNKRKTFSLKLWQCLFPEPFWQSALFLDPLALGKNNNNIIITLISVEIPKYRHNIPLHWRIRVVFVRNPRTPIAGVNGQQHSYRAIQKRRQYNTLVFKLCIFKLREWHEPE